VQKMWTDVNNLYVILCFLLKVLPFRGCDEYFTGTGSCVGEPL